MKNIFSIILLLLVACQSSQMQKTEEYNPNLQISVRKKSDTVLPVKVNLSLQELKKELHEETFEVVKHPVYENKSMKYKGFYFKDVVKLITQRLKIEKSEQFIFSIWASDNFSAFIDQNDLKTGNAFLAYQEVQGGFTPIPKHGDPGPYYLVWDNPEKTYWQKWPFKIAEVTFVEKNITEKFSLLRADDDFDKTKGYRLVLKNCVSCHQISGVGYGQMGPDLKWLVKNRSESEFNNQIRQPSGKMVPFNRQQLSDNDIKAIYSYLKALK